MPGKSQPPAGIDHWQDSMINIAYNVCSIVTMPVELALRPFHGTRCFPPLIMFMSALMMLFIPVFFSVAASVGRLIPFVRIQAQMGLIGMFGFTKLFFLGSLIHGVRKWRLMLHMEREQNSVYEGPPLFFFTWLPGATFWRVRIVYEPLFLLGLSIVLPNLFIIEPGAGDFLFVSAFFLAMKNYAGWYMHWQFLRELMDSRNAAPIIARLVDNTASDEELATIHLASIPKDTPEDLRKDTAEQIARAWSPATH